MLKTVEWHTRPFIISVTLSGVISLTDCAHSIAAINDLLAASGRPFQTVHLLVDFSERTGLSAEILNVNVMMRFAKNLPPLGWIAAVSPHPNPLMRFVADTVCARLKLRYRVFTTRAAACHFLQSQIAREGGESAQQSA